MSLNIISDPWIPALRGGERVVIRPDQIAEPGVSTLVWERADFRLACLELLIGLVSMADPPGDDAEWRVRFCQPDAKRLRKALEPFAPYFALAGDGPRFLQDLEPFENAARLAKIKLPDILYIDSAAAKTIQENADLMVKRNRFTCLPLPEAAMALYTFQAFAPPGGRGYRTSMRGKGGKDGNGSMTTLVQPVDDGDVRFPLWRLVFANVLPGPPLAVEDAERALPWLRPTCTSEKDDQFVTPTDTHLLEAFFGMPRRLRLKFKEDRVTGVVEELYGTNYKAWEHPLTPYSREKEDDPKWWPVHPKTGHLGYRNWLGITMEPGQKGRGTMRPARVVRECRNRSRMPDFELMVGGWAMKNMKPLDFSLDQYPAFPGLDEDGEDRVRRLVDAAEEAAKFLRSALSKSTCRKALKSTRRFNGKFADAVIETFFAETEGEFVRIIRSAATKADEVWFQTIKDTAVRLFDDCVLGGLTDRDVAGIERRIKAKSKLLSNFEKRVRKTLCLPAPAKDKKEKKA